MLRRSRSSPGSTAAAPQARRRRGVLARTVDAAHAAIPVAALTLAVAVGVVMIFELSHVQTDPWQEPAERLATYPAERTGLGVLIVWACVLVLYALTGRMWATAGLALLLAGVGAYADRKKMAMRGEPLYPSDVAYLRQPGLLLDVVGISPQAALAVLATVVAAVALLVVLRARRRRAQPTRARRASRARWAGRAVAGIAGAAVLVVAGGFNEPGNALRSAFDSTSVYGWAKWDQVENYAENGFVAGFLYNLPASAMTRPDGYGPQRMAEVAERYTRLAEGTNADRNPAALDGANIVVILGESFTDPTRIEGLELAEDPMPFTRSLMAATTSGTMLTPGYGGGTANAEFEVLTGMALSNFGQQMHTPYQMLIPNHDRFPSHLTTLAEGRETLAVHPYLRSYYRRDAVYPALGFDRSIFLPDMPRTDRIENDLFVSDAATYGTVVDELRSTDAPMLVNAVTMQNHVPYAGKYSDPVEISGPLAGTLGPEAGHYVRGLAHSDRAMEQLVTDLRALDEPTVVLFYGDHQPSFWPDSVRAAAGEQVMHETPWFAWANFPTTKIETPPVLSPYHLVDQLLATADAPVSPFGALLAELAREAPAIEPTMMLDGAGQGVTDADLSPRARELLADYRIVQYDLTVGGGYAVEEMLTVP